MNNFPAVIITDVKKKKTRITSRIQPALNDILKKKMLLEDFTNIITEILYYTLAFLGKAQLTVFISFVN